MPAGNWLLPEHHHRVQHLPLVAMFHAQHFKPSLAHDVGELLRLVQPESLPVARERPQAGGGPEAARQAPAALHHPRHFAQTGDQVRPIVQAVDGQHLVERPGAKRQFGYVAPLDRNACVQLFVADQAGRRLDHLAGVIDPHDLRSRRLRRQRHQRETAAIMQSGVPLDLHPSVHHSGAGVDSAEKLGADLAHKLAAGEGPDAINKLRSASTDDVFKAAADMGFDAVVDGWVLSDQPLVMFAHHQQADVPVMVGSTAREFSNLIGSDEVTLETFRDWVKNSFQPLADDVLRMYPVPSSADARDAFIRAGTDLGVFAPSRWTAGTMQGMKSKAYLYNVTWTVPTPGGKELGAFHGTDVALLFDSPKLPRDEAGNALADAMRR